MEATLDPTLFNSLTEVLSEANKLDAAKTVAELQTLNEKNLALPEYLKQFAIHVADLYATTSVAIWFRSDSGDGPQRKVAIGWENLLLDDAAGDAHLRLIKFSLDQKDPHAYSPFSAPANFVARTQRISNPTDSYLLLMPVLFEGKGVAVLEIVLGPKPLRTPHANVMQNHVRWLEWLGGILESGIQHGFEQADQPLMLALSVLQQTSQDVEAIQRQILVRIEQTLQQFVGKNFGSLAANQAIAKQVHTLLDSKGLRVRCPECGSAAILRCQNAGNAKTGAFMFDHYLDTGRTFHGGQTTFPEVSVVPKPARRKAK